MKLDNVLSVKVGVAQFETTDEGVNNLAQVGLVTGANISELGDLDFVDAELKYVYVSAEKLHDNVLKVGDIVLMSRGSNMRAAIVNQQDADKGLIASPNCLVLTANLNYVLPEVIVAFLNSELGQKTLDSLSTGATIKNVPARKIKDIDLRVPDLAVQNKIAQIFKQNIETLKSLKVLQMQQKITANAAIQKLMAE
ncbi:restriction endonuclease subunit S [Acinetobacter towneri]|uniref:restriction endonuclease subunit S n=1 Tax=Acinetobacter towneri TaxID=202956 RepID=UPI00293555D5|nr:restriction endonuclease subunit S [Acinetobacter towneri]MDV2483524.1 restriction endonuclease subunit S [Acinetobacter towneri]